MHRVLGKCGRLSNGPHDIQVLVLLYMSKGTLQMWLSLGSGDGEVTLEYLSGPSVIAGICLRGRRDVREEVGDVSTKARCWSDMRKRSQDKECMWLPEARKSKETDIPQGPPEETSLVNTLTLAYWNGFGTFVFQNCKRINLCCLF